MFFLYFLLGKLVKLVGIFCVNTRFFNGNRKIQPFFPKLSQNGPVGSDRVGRVGTSGLGRVDSG